MIHIDTIYESEAFRLLQQGMKDREAVNIIAMLMQVDMPTFRTFETWCSEQIQEQEEELAKLKEPILVGDLTDRHIFKPAGITNVAAENQQALWGRVEEVLEEILGNIKRLQDRVLEEGMGREHAEKQRDVAQDEREQAVKKCVALEAKYKMAEDAWRELETTASEIGWWDKGMDLSAVIKSKYRQVRHFMQNSFDGFQKKSLDVYKSIYDNDPTNMHERACRFFEEVCELMQVVGIHPDELGANIKRTYSRPISTLDEELGDTFATFSHLLLQCGRPISDVAENGLGKMAANVDRIKAKRATRRGALPGHDPIAYPSQGGHVVYAPTLDGNTEPQTFTITPPRDAKWYMGHPVRKKSGGEWAGHVVGFYTTALTPIGYAVESKHHKGSVQIYPEAALETDLD